MGREAKASAQGRALAAKRAQAATDPPIEPHAETVEWFTTGPDPILDDAETAVLMMRVGMAYNALQAQLQAGVDARKHTGAVKTRALVLSLITASAFTREALEVLGSGMRVLRPLAQKAGAPEELLKRIGRLRGGDDPAAKVLHFARNQIGFHWDRGLVALSLAAFATNKTLVWLETDSEGNGVHRLATDVIGHALMPAAGSEIDPDRAQYLTMMQTLLLDKAMTDIIEFCTAATYGYLSSIGAQRHTRVCGDREQSNP